MSLFAKLSSYDDRSARLAGIGLMLLSIFMFSVGDAMGKFIVATYSVGQLLWLRACAALLVLLPSAALLGLAVNITAASFKKYL